MLSHAEDRWDEKRVMVTAGAFGIGRSFAEIFRKAGARVSICDILPDRVEEARKAMPGVHAMVADVAEPDQVDAYVAAAVAELGSVDILINNAGIAGPAAAIEDIAPADWSKTFAVNVAGMFHCARRVVPLMKQAGKGGSIVNMSSVAGKFGFPLRSPYAASKWAVVGLTQSWAIELGAWKIRVNCLQPGIVSGQRNREVFGARAQAKGISYDEMARQAVERVSLKSMVDPEEVAQMGLYLCSWAGRNVTGQAIAVCGGTESIV